jgi:environmental stress-induced protein Ves
MTWQIISLADVPPSPWKNGGGVTRELVAWPSASHWRWRMSVAEVESSGPFSRFEGVQRWFVVLSGAGVRLNIGAEAGLAEQDNTHSLTRASAPLCFAGELPVQCTLLDGPTQDFNLMLRRDHVSATMQRVSGELSATLDTTKIIAIYAESTWARVLFCHEVMNLPPNTLAWRHCDAGATLQVHAAHALWMEIAT